MILVDTSSWSRALRRKNDALSEQARTQLRTLRLQQQLAIPGIALQELLSQLRDQGQVQRLRRAIAPIPVHVATLEDHQIGADLANACRWRGVQTSLADCLIAAQAIRLEAWVLSHDGDFAHMLPHCPGLRLIAPL